ncbi:PREDICTED: gustatory receptor 68a-like [Nicrophorus vespilloides]|uniref:Gustatory receptor 68a-like n=1 Tax=Nicrophorus vespilloides TaxID=110193 RepID=A0ABM1MQ55_NICVS|nr:PREDICTED: gustatory receptor 68a-like [Nicrophorus vespilloides]
MALVYGNGEREVNGIRLGAELIALCVIWASFPMIISTGMFSACGSGANEAAKTATICYDILHSLPSNDQFKQTRNDIIELAEQACNKAPTFTAAGFFTIDTSSLFALFGAVTSYLIVLIQFNK